jgi:hypothetical protein
MTEQLPRRFMLVRDVDTPVAEGIEFTDSTVAVRSGASTLIYMCVAEMEGESIFADTRVVWTDDQLWAGLLALLEGKNAELKRHHLDARVGNLQGSRVALVREVLEQWAPAEGTPLEALWIQVREAVESYSDEIARIHAESDRGISGIDPTA